MVGCQLVVRSLFAFAAGSLGWAPGAMAASPTATSAFSSQIADAGPLGVAQAAPATPQGRVAVRNVLFAPAPVPDDGASHPSDNAAPTGPTVAPHMFSAKNGLDEGDGYSKGSSAEASRDSRSHPAAGLSWSVPVQ